MKQERLSVAIPLYNEEKNCPELLRRLQCVLDRIPGGPHEIVIVNDGSTDGTLKVLEEAAKEDNRVVVISLSRNFGHQAALTAALDHVSGDVTVVMDGDLQDTPESIPLFLEQYQKGHDVVYAKRIGRKENWRLQLCYFAFYRILAFLSDIRLPVDAGDFALMSRQVIEQIRQSPEHQRYLRGLRTWVGFKQIGIEIERSERFSGQSKYSFFGLLKLALNGIFAFSIVPLRASVVLGIVAMLLTSLFALYALYAKFFLDQSPQGFTALILVITFLSGVNLFFLGVIGEYVGRIYEEAKGRPLYIIEKAIGKTAPTSVENLKEPS
jgi:dolichol-phosphate mannosyltransferase